MSRARGFQDYEYFWLLRQAGKGQEADRLVNSVIHATPFGEKSPDSILRPAQGNMIAVGAHSASS